MRQTRILGVVVAALALAVAAAPVSAAAKAKKEHPVRGVVTKVEKNKDGNTITVKTGGHKNKKTGETTPVVEKTFKVTDATKYLTVSGKKGDVQTTAATLDDVKEGAHVSVTVDGDAATEVRIGHHGKKKAAA